MIWKLILNGFGFSWFQVYDCTGVSGRINFLVSRQIYETLQLTSDNLWENDDFGESDLSSGQVLPLGLSISDPVPINERIKLIKEKLVNIFSSLLQTQKYLVDKYRYNFKYNSSMLWLFYYLVPLQSDTIMMS